MKELRIKIGMIREQKSTEEERDILLETMCVLGRIVDDAIYNSIMAANLDEDLYVKALERIVYSYEEGDLDKAKEQLYMIACLVDYDAAFILENVVYPNDEGVYWFFQHFCEHLIDFRVIDKMFYDEECRREAEDTLDNGEDE